MRNEEVEVSWRLLGSGSPRMVNCPGPLQEYSSGSFALRPLSPPALQSTW